MFKHTYIAARVNRRTYLKGRFSGKFVGRLDPSSSDPMHERFYDLEILEGEIETRQDDLVPWMEGKEPSEFAAETIFPLRLPGKVNVTLHYLNGEVAHFKIALKQIKLKDCHLSGQIYSKSEVHGQMEGLISGYVLHHEMLVNEITEDVPPIKPPTIEGPKITKGEKKEPIVETHPGDIQTTEPSPTITRLLQVLGGFIGLSLLIAAFLLVTNWTLMLVGATGVGLLIRWLKRWTSKRYGSRISRTITTLLIVLTLTVLVFYLAGRYGESIYTKSGRTKQAALSNTTELKDKAANFLANNNHTDALQLYNQLLEIEPSNSLLHYQRALCYVRAGQIAKAVADLKLLISKGDTAAIALHNRINPPKQRQIGTQIRCNDGFISHSKHRRGTCSDHKGVKDWNEPVYREYRQY